MQRGISDLGMLAGRLALALLYVQAGWSKVVHWPGIVHLLTHLDAPAPTLGAVIAVVCELGAGGLVMLGLRTRPAAIVLILFTIAANWLAHRFWLMQGQAAAAAEIQFFLDLAICGGLLLLASAGPGRFSLDRR
ncbi:DoxX family protein [Acidiphilium multivorum]|jgi:putative oxidoreductase|uniref:DoxX family protein n=2 Tax=Acidiphilium TaxID=522 RepID=A5FVG5_ACICJ|nr:DoxX family protein [Blastomonas sp.]ABQ29597.1 DoxX family protein [Acidiphilium cryptum JF-5]EGO96774.1 DoxX family protein [Acidiphilium sp. PM]MBS3025001.1 DoxX family protein [Acidiphilium multivorum]MBU6356865.1 DoxX family protein [Rhodospirillales bacterium]MDE2327882.1 DoxX family protein [Rhodospirillales bacterium]